VLTIFGNLEDFDNLGSIADFCLELTSVTEGVTGDL
jgi:hypothetical protein